MRIENEELHYRAKFDVFPYKTQNPAFPKLCQVLWDWLREKERRRHSAFYEALSATNAKEAFSSGEFSWPKDYLGGSGDVETCLSVAAISSNGRRLWAMEYDEQDQHFWFRRWHTCVGISSGPSGDCRVNVRIFYYAKSDYIGRQGPAPFANVPNFVREMVELEAYQCCVGETVLESCETYLTEDDFEGDFVDNLSSDQRELPLILMCTDEKGGTPVWDAEKFAHKLVGMANVYIVDWRNRNLRKKLFGLFVRGDASFNYRCGSSTPRIYKPGIDLSDADNWRNNPFFPKARIDDICGGDERYLEKFIEIVAKSLGRAITTDGDDVADLGDIDRVRILESANKLKEQYRELKARSLATEHGPHVDGLGEVERLKEELVEWQRIADDYAASNDREISRSEELRDRCDDLSNKVTFLTFSLQDMRTRAKSLQEEAKALSHASSVMSTLSSIPKNLEDELQFAEALWPNRITVLPEAYSSANGYPVDVDEAWRMLSAMADTLWDLCFSDDSNNLDKEFHERTGFKHSSTERGLTKSNSELMRLRKRQYQGREIDIISHVKGKSGPRDERFRIYYCADAKTRHIVIGHAGGHLPTSGTSRL